MANTYTQIHLQFVFAVRFRRAMIHPSWSENLYGYITGIVQGNGHKMLAINGMPDHVHILIGMRPKQSISDLLKQVKGDSAAWVNKEGLASNRFSWQNGYGAFSYSLSQVSRIIHYIHNQQQHHKKQTFAQEYQNLLNESGVEYDLRYLFKDPW